MDKILESQNLSKVTDEGIDNLKKNSFSKIEFLVKIFLHTGKSRPK